MSGPEEPEIDEHLIERVRAHEPEDGEELEDDEVIDYGDSPGAGILGVMDDLPEPNEPG